MLFICDLDILNISPRLQSRQIKIERVSNDVITSSAARGALEDIYWKPQMRWLIEEIRVLTPIRFTNIRRNAAGSSNRFSSEFPMIVAPEQECLPGSLASRREAMFDRHAIFT